jgi:hypothetical protein
MKLLLVLLFTTTSLFAHARLTNALVKNETISSIMAKCVPTMLFAGLFIAGAVYLLNANKKRRDK